MLAIKSCRFSFPPSFMLLLFDARCLLKSALSAECGLLGKLASQVLSSGVFFYFLFHEAKEEKKKKCKEIFFNCWLIKSAKLLTHSWSLCMQSGSGKHKKSLKINQAKGKLHMMHVRARAHNHIASCVFLSCLIPRKAKKKKKKKKRSKQAVKKKLTMQISYENLCVLFMKIVGWRCLWLIEFIWIFFTNFKDGRDLNVFPWIDNVRKSYDGGEVLATPSCPSAMNF